MHILRVGYWGNARGGMAIAFDLHGQGWARSNGGRFRVEIGRDRSIVIKPCPDGTGVFFHGDRSMASYDHILRTSHMKDRSVLTLAPGIELPAFELMFVDFVERGDELHGTLPDDHELHWPGVSAFRGLTAEAAATLAQEGLQARVNSLIASGLNSFSNDMVVPAHVRRLLPMGAFIEARNLARSLAGVV